MHFLFAIFAFQLTKNNNNNKLKFEKLKRFIKERKKEKLNWQKKNLFFLNIHYVCRLLINDRIVSNLSHFN